MTSLPTCDAVPAAPDFGMQRALLNRSFLYLFLTMCGSRFADDDDDAHNFAFAFRIRDFGGVKSSMQNILGAVGRTLPAKRCKL